MRISCIILNYNDYITVHSLVEHIENYSIIQEIIIIDNCSTDDSYEKLLKLNREKIIVIRSKKNGGYGYGNNYGIRYAIKHFKADMILICNPDILFDEVLIKKMAKALYIDKSYTVASAIPYTSEKKIQKGYAWRVPTILQCVLSSGKILQKFFRFGRYPDDYCLKNDVTEVECVPGSFLLVKSDLMQKYGMYDEDVFLYCEETILGYKLKEKKLKSIIINQPYLHLHSVSIDKSISSTVNQRKIMYKSWMLYITRYRGAGKLVAGLCKIYFAIVLYENYFDGLIKKVKNIIYPEVW